MQVKTNGELIEEWWNAQHGTQVLVRMCVLTRRNVHELLKCFEALSFVK